MSRAAETRRSNDEWILALRGAGPAAELAQVELRALVQDALRKATRGFGSVDDATLEDLTQVSTLSILQRLGRFEGRSRFTTWAYSVAVHAAFSELRKAPYRNGPPAAEAALAEPAVGAGDETTRPVEHQEIVDVLYRVIEEELTERQREAILGELRGTATPELARELRTNTNALYKLLHDARAKLRDGLCAAGICDEEVREAFGL